MNEPDMEYLNRWKEYRRLKRTLLARICGWVPLGLSSAVAELDGSANTATVTGAGGAVLDAYSYLPFGEKLQSTVTVTNPFTFAGQVGIRDDGDGANFYAYVKNNPIRFVDPYGLKLLDCVGRCLRENFGSKDTAAMGVVTLGQPIIEKLHHGYVSILSKCSEEFHGNSPKVSGPRQAKCFGRRREALGALREDGFRFLAGECWAAMPRKRAFARTGASKTAGVRTW